MVKGQQFVANNLIVLFRNDSDPFVVQQLWNASTKDNINLHSNTEEVWLKMAKQNNPETLYLIRGTKPNGGFDGIIRFQHIDPSVSLSLLTGFNPGRYQAEIFISSNTYTKIVNSVDTAGLFTVTEEHDLATGEKIYFDNVPDSGLNDEIGNKEFTVTVLSPTTFTVDESWTFPASIVNFSQAIFYNISEQETSVAKSPYHIKGDFTP